jgi:two-component system cell cycle sensor histidine kinase/response regulator CckA
MGCGGEERDAELSSLRAERDAAAAELSLARSYRDAVDASPIAIACISTATGRYVFANEAFAQLLGHAREQLLASDPYHIWAASKEPADLEAEHLAIERIAKGETSRCALENLVRSTSGERHWCRSDLVGQLDAHGRLAYLTVYVTDLHRHHVAAQAKAQIEEQLLRAAKLSAAGQIVGGLAHDFNNCLMVIMGHTELLKAELEPHPVLAERAEIILASAHGGADLTRQLMAYGRRQVLKAVRFDLNETVRRMRRLLDSVLGDRIELTARLAAEHQVLADPGQIEQVILNLVFNARDAMPEGGTLSLSTEDALADTAGLPSAAPAGGVVLRVSDTGAGMPPEVLARIYEPFFTTKPNGAGLGLAMVEGIVQQSGGAMTVESKVGGGTLFTIVLQRAGEEVRPPLAARPERALPASTGLETVLVCDDNPEVCDLMASVLSLRGYTILRARDGQQALALAHKGKLHLLVTDVAMPGLDGIGLAAELRKNEPELSVLYVSGYAEDAERVAASLGPRTWFIPKPFLPADLTRTVWSMLEGGAQ